MRHNSSTRIDRVAACCAWVIASALLIVAVGAPQALAAGIGNTELVESDTPTSNVEAGPALPVLSLRHRQVVGSRFTLRGTKEAGIATITVLASGRAPVDVPVSEDATRFAVPLSRVPYQRSVIAVKASNSFGTTQTAWVEVWNLGRTLKRRTQMIVDRSECRLYWVKDGRYVRRYSVAVGTPRTPTPTGEHVVTAKKRITNQRRSSMGAYWMRLHRVTGSGSRFQGYFIHGTSWRRIIGLPASMGCVNMYDPQILRFGPVVPVGTHVLIRE